MNVFSTWAIQHFTAGSITWSGKEIGVVLLTRAPSDPSPNAPQGVGDATHAGLSRSLGYSEQVDANYSRVDVPVTSSMSGTTTRVIIGEDFPLPENVAPAYIKAAAFFLKGDHDGVRDPWLFVSDITFNQIVYEGSTLTTRTQAPRILFTYTPRGATVDAAAGGLIRSPGEAIWEPPRVQHIFLYPERVNYIPNPSFEDIGMFGWRAAGGILQAPGGVDSPANAYAAVAGNRLEALPVATTSGLHRLSGYFRSKGATKIRLGLAVWADDWLAPTDNMGLWKPISGEWTRIDTLAQPPDGHSGAGFLAQSDGAFDVDMCLMENTADLNTYFDGDSTFGFIGSFSWQGVPHRSLSFWYNNRNLVGARLFGEYTEGSVSKKGLVFDWLPEGTPVYTHWNVLTTRDTRQPFQDWPSHTI